MKTKIFILCIIVLLSNLYSQEWINSTNFSNSDIIKSVKFINVNTGLVLIYNSGNTPNCRILKTINKGITWNVINSFNATVNSDNGISMYYLDDNTVFRFYKDTEYYILLVEMSTDGGYTWNNVWYQNVYPKNPKIIFINQNTGFFTYSYKSSNNKYVGAIYKTINGGYNWSYKHIVQKSDANCLINDIAYNFYNGTFDIWAFGEQTLIDAPYYSNYFRCKSSDLGETFSNVFDPGNAYYNTFNFAKGLNNAPQSFAVIGLKKENTQTQKTYCTIFNSENRNEIHINDNEYEQYLGGLSESNGKLFSVVANKIFMSSNSGLNWNDEYTFSDVVNFSYDIVWSYNDIAYFGTWHGQFYTRKIFGNYNTNFDWQGGNGSIAIDGQNIGTPSTGYFRGGSTNLYALPYIVNGSDTTAMFHYWGGDCNGSMNWNNNSSYLVNSGSNINADYKTKLKSTTANSLKNANQVKVLKDTNGVTNLIYESMGGIFYTRTKPDGTFKAEEVLSSSAYLPLQGFATFNNKNPYLSENKNTNNPEANVWACWERREGNNIKIMASARIYDIYSPPEWPKHYWGTNELITLTNVPDGFECMPKIFVAGGDANPLRVLTYLKPDGANKKIVGKVYTTTTLEQEFDITVPGNIYEYAVAAIYPYYGVTFQLHIAYRINQTVYYKSVKIGQLSAWQGIQPIYEVLNQDVNISSDNSQWRASLDIALKNNANSTSLFNMQPVVTYQGKTNVKIIIENEDGPPLEITANKYPIYVKEKLTNGWSSSIVSYENPNIDEPQMTPVIEGSKQMNSCIVSYGKGYNAPYTFNKVVHRWNGVVNSGYVCNPVSFTGTDSKLIKSSLINNSSTTHKLMTLNSNGGLYDVSSQPFTIINGAEEDETFDAISGLIQANDVQYTFNLGNILVNNQNIGFAADIDTNINNLGQLNSNLASVPFLLNENDTLIIGRNAAYVLNDPNAVPVNIEYWVKLINKTTSTMHRLLAHDTLNVADSVLYEFLEGYVIRNIPNGSDSFYVQLEIDTVDGNYGVGGGIGGDGLAGGDSPNGSMKKKIFWEGENITAKNNNIPTEFMLYQNFPNPFNPATIIKYDLPKDVKVTVKIYDLLGREVTTLVNNEFKHAGRYQLNWNAGKYASGVYIYRIEVRQAGSATVDYVSTKKMVVLK